MKGLLRRSNNRARVVAVVLTVLALSSGCAQPGAAPAAPRGPTVSTASSLSTPPTGHSSSDLWRSGVFPTTRVEPPTDADRPDGPTPTPDDELTVADLAGLVRLEASAPAAADRCAPQDVRLSLTGIDAAAGHRYARLIAANTSDRTCTLVGWPGLGFRGEWGAAFPVVAERSEVQVERVGVPPASPDVALDPGDRAAAEFEWTGALAGARDEPVSLIAVQFAADGPAAGLAVLPEGHVDLGPDTTVRIGAWGPAGL